MNPINPGDVLAQFLSGNTVTALKLLLAFAVISYGAVVLKQVGSKLTEFLRWAQGKGNEWSLLAMTTIDDRFFELLQKAVANQTHMAEMLKDAFADGVITQEELKAIVESIWADFKANTGVGDLNAFAQAMLGNASAPGAERALRAKFDANVYRMIGPMVQEASARSLTRRMRRMEVRSMERNLAPPQAMVGGRELMPVNSLDHP